MGGLTSMVGLGGGFAGSGVAGPGQAQIVNPITQAQTDQSYVNTQEGLNNQSLFLAALQGQNGIGNQSATFNQLQNIANGVGPDPAKAQLAQATGQNVANQAALMAGQRGSSANVGLMARQAAQAGGNIQQQAAGQGATMEAQQRLNAINSMGNLATSQVNQQANATNAYSQGAQGEQSNIFNMLGNVNSSSVGSQSSLNNANGSIIANSQKSQAGIMSALGGAFLAEGGMVPSNTQAITPIQVAPQNDPSGNTGPKSQFGKAMQTYKTAIGGSPSNQDPFVQGGSAIGSALGKGIKSLFSSQSPAAAMPSASPAISPDAPGTPFDVSQEGVDLSNAAMGLGDSQMIAGLASGAALAAKGGMVKALVSPGEQALAPKDVKEVVKDGKNPLSVGERIPGTPKYPGNDYRNDVVPKALEEGGIVIPNKIMQSKDPAKEAAKFVAAVLKKQALKKSK